MNKGQLVDRMAQASGISKTASEKALNEFMDAIADALGAGDKVTLVGFGTFQISERQARTGRNPRTGKPIEIPAKKIVKFKPEEWVETFSGDQPVQVTFDLQRPYPLDRVRTFFYGELSAVEAETSIDGHTWQPAGSHPGRRTGFEEVALLQLPLSAAFPARYLRLAFKRDGQGEAALALCEMEVWSK